METIVRRTRSKWFLATNDFYDEDRGEPYIDWIELLSDIPGGTKHQRSYLLKSVKGFMEAMVNAPRSDGKHPSRDHAIILHRYREVQLLVAWMTARGIWKFSSLSSEDVYCFMLERAVRVSGVGKVGARTLQARMYVLKQLWLLRSKYVAPLSVNPLSLEVPSDKVPKSTKWKAIDEPAALALLKDALNWMESTGPFVVKALDDLWQLSKVVGQTKRQRSKSRADFFSQLESAGDIGRLRDCLGMPGRKTYRVLNSAVMITNGACAVVVLFLVGLRIGEFVRLDDDCLAEEVDSSGISIKRIKGIAAKQQGKHRSWIACDEVAAAIALILKLTDNSRKESGRRPLWLIQPGVIFPLSGRKQSRISSNRLASCMKAFAHGKFRASSPTIKRIHPHAARKTFAKFVVLRNKSALGALSRHFGHICTSITDGTYVGSDIELEEMLSEQGRVDLANALMDLLVAQNAAGKAADAIAKTRSQVPTFKGRKGLERLVEKLIDDGVQLAPCDWGYCVYSQSLSACHGDSRGPNEARRSADVCSTCANFAVTDQHRPWWEGRMKQDDEFLERPGLGEQTVAWVKRRRANSARIVAGLLPQRQRTEPAGG